MSDRDKRIAEGMRAIAAQVENALERLTGDRAAFVLIAGIDDVSQYISNLDRPSAKQLLQQLANQWAEAEQQRLN